MICFLVFSVVILKNWLVFYFNVYDDDELPSADPELIPFGASGFRFEHLDPEVTPVDIGFFSYECLSGLIGVVGGIVCR